MTSTSRSAPSSLAGEDHPADARVERAGARASCRASVSSPLAVERADLLEHAVALVDGALRRRVEERESRSMSPSPSDFICRMAPARPDAEDLGIGVGGRSVEVLLVVEAEADAAPHAARAPLALIGARREIGSIRSCVTPERGVVAVDAREAGVDDVDDARDGERRLGDVRGEHDAALRGGAGRRAPARPGERRAVERQDHRVRQPVRERARPSASRISRSPGRKTRMSSRGSSAVISSTASATASASSSSSSRGGR